jgi:hypothetical protein
MVKGMYSGINTKCKNCGKTAFYLHGTHNGEPRCVQCEEVERSLVEYAKHEAGRRMLVSVLRFVEQNEKGEPCDKAP